MNGPDIKLLLDPFSLIYLGLHSVVALLTMDLARQRCQSSTALPLQLKMTFNSLFELIGLTVGQRWIDGPLAIEKKNIDKYVVSPE